MKRFLATSEKSGLSLKTLRRNNAVRDTAKKLWYQICQDTELGEFRMEVAANWDPINMLANTA
jgi:hypothetical protein